MRTLAEALLRGSIGRKYGPQAAGGADVRARRNFESERAAAEKKKKKKKRTGLFSGLLGRGKKQGPGSGPGEEEEVPGSYRTSLEITAEDREVLFSTIEYDADTAQEEYLARQSALPPGYQSLRVSFVLQKGSFTLKMPTVAVEHTHADGQVLDAANGGRSRWSMLSRHRGSVVTTSRRMARRRTGGGQERQGNSYPLEWQDMISVHVTKAAWSYVKRKQGGEATASLEDFFVRDATSPISFFPQIVFRPKTAVRRPRSTAVRTEDMAGGWV
jgi:hypothetical protein